MFNFFKDLVRVNVDQFIIEFDEEEVINHLLKVEIWPDNEQTTRDIINAFLQYKFHVYESKNMELCIKDLSKAWGIKKLLNIIKLI